MREAKCMREVHNQHFACTLKIASEQRATAITPGSSWFVLDCFLKLQNSTRECLRQNMPPPFAEPPLGAQDNSLIYRRLAWREKNALRQLQTSNDTCVSVERQLRWMQEIGPIKLKIAAWHQFSRQKTVRFLTTGCVGQVWI